MKYKLKPTVKFKKDLKIIAKRGLENRGYLDYEIDLLNIITKYNNIKK